MDQTIASLGWNLVIDEVLRKTDADPDRALALLMDTGRELIRLRIDEAHARAFIEETFGKRFWCIVCDGEHVEDSVPDECRRELEDAERSVG